jgi:hypothetical protein
MHAVNHILDPIARKILQQSDKNSGNRYIMEKRRIAVVRVRQSYITAHTRVEHNMKMKVEIKFKFKVNGEEYSSPEEKLENILNAMTRL